MKPNFPVRASGKVALIFSPDRLQEVIGAMNIRTDELFWTINGTIT